MARTGYIVIFLLNWLSAWASLALAYLDLHGEGYGWRLMPAAVSFAFCVWMLRADSFPTHVED